MLRILLLLISGLWLLLSANTYACSVTAFNTAAFDINDVIIPPGNHPAGTVLYSVDVVSSGGGFFDGSCKLHAVYDKGVLTGLKYHNTDVATTNIPGVGFVICGNGSCDSGTLPVFVSTKSTNVKASYGGLKQTFKLIATGEPISSGTLDTGLYGNIHADTNLKIIDYSVGSGTIKAVNCTIDSNKDIQVDFGAMPASTFGGASSTSATKTFDVKMTCDGQANISATLEGAQSPAGDATVLALSNQGDPQTASGLGVQILYNGTPLTIGTPLPLKTTAGNVQELFQFGARYYQTGAQVTEGGANAAATLVITHQ